MNNKEKIAYIGLTASLLFGGVACGKQLRLVDAPTSTPITSADKPKETPSNGDIAGQIADLAKAVAELKGTERLINIPSVPVVVEKPVASEQPAVKQTAPVVENTTPKQTPNETVKSPTITEGGKFTVSGLPERVDPKNVLVAKGPDGYGNNFVDTLPFGAEMFAEPGVLKFSEISQAELDKLGKSAERFNPANQAVISTEQGSWSVRENGFTVLNGNNMEIEVAGNDTSKPFRINLGGDEVNHTIVVLRGLFPDKSTPQDRNRTVKIFNHPAGHTLADSYPLGAFISSGHMKQMIENAYTSYPNNGDSGARKMTVFTLDLNTGAWAYYGQAGINGKWDLIGSNWKN